MSIDGSVENVALLNFARLLTVYTYAFRFAAQLVDTIAQLTMLSQTMLCVQNRFTVIDTLARRFV